MSKQFYSCSINTFRYHYQDSLHPFHWKGCNESCAAVLPIYLACWHFLKMFKMLDLLDESVWMMSSGPVGPWQYMLQVDIVVGFENWNWNFNDTSFIFQFLQALWPIYSDIIMILWYYDSPDLLRLALLPVPTFFTIFFTTFILEGLQKVWNQEGDYFIFIFTGSTYFLYFHRINLFSRLSHMDTPPKI